MDDESGPPADERLTLRRRTPWVDPTPSCEAFASAFLVPASIGVPVDEVYVDYRQWALLHGRDDVVERGPFVRWLRTHGGVDNVWLGHRLGGLWLVGCDLRVQALMELERLVDKPSGVKRP